MIARYVNQFVSEMIEPWQQEFTICALHYEIINYLTVAAYLVPDLPNVRGFSGFFWRSILMFFSDALFARSSKHKDVSKVDYLSWRAFLKSPVDYSDR